MVEQLTLITVLFAAVLAFALLIERAIEVLKAVYDLVDSYFDFAKYWTKKTHQTQKFMQKQLRVFEYVNPKQATSVFNRFHELMLGPSSGYQGTVPMLCGDLMRAFYVKIGCKVVGMGLGILIAFYLKFDLLAAAQTAAISSLVPTFKGMLLTGVALGLGAGPMHKIIRAVEKKRDSRFPEARLPEAVTNV
jgi:hypothetical protein